MEVSAPTCCPHSTYLPISCGDMSSRAVKVTRLIQCDVGHIESEFLSFMAYISRRLSGVVVRAGFPLPAPAACANPAVSPLHLPAVGGERHGRSVRHLSALAVLFPAMLS